MSFWTAEQEALLTELWYREPQLSTNLIGQWIGGFSKNAVIGKAHRLDLEPRSNPIMAQSPEVTEDRKAQLRIMKSDGCSQRHMADHLGVSQSWVQKLLRSMGLSNAPILPRRTLPALPSLQAVVAAVKRPVAIPVLVQTPKPAPRATSFGPCCWVIGSGKSARYCSDPITVRGPYCDDHRKLAYRKTVDRRTLEEVA